jgi:hypothetical protein
MTLTIPTDLEAALVRLAQLQGTTPEAVALRQLRERLLPTPAETATISHEEMKRIRQAPPGREGGLASNPGVGSE